LPLLGPLESTTHYCAEKIITAIFYIFPVVRCEIPVATWDRLGQLIVLFFQSIAATGDLIMYRDFAIEILSAAKPARNPPFYRAIVDSIVEIFRAAMGAESHRISILLEILAVSLQQEIIDDPQPIFALALDVLRHSPTAEVFPIFSRCPQLVMPEHLQEIEFGNDFRMQIAFLEFLAVYGKGNPEGFREFLNLEWLFQLFDHCDEQIVIAALKILNTTVQSPQGEKLLEQTLNIVPRLLFEKLENGKVSVGLTVLQTVATLYVGYEPVLNAVGRICGNSPEWELFAIAFRQGRVDKDLASITNRLIRGQQHMERSI
jgi:hypothetical protein